MSKAKIVVVEDEILVSESIKRSLERNGYHVLDSATNGERAIQCVETHNPDLILMDIFIRGEMDGIETAEIINSRFGTPVVFLTAHSDDETLKRAKVSGPFGYLIKPFDERQLAITIDVALYKNRMEREREKLVAELQKALAEVKTLRGLIPICSICKKIRDDNGFWERLEEYLSKHSDVQFTHGICPDCMSTHYPELDL